MIFQIYNQLRDWKRWLGRIAIFALITFLGSPTQGQFFSVVAMAIFWGSYQKYKSTPFHQSMPITMRQRFWGNVTVALIQTVLMIASVVLIHRLTNVEITHPEISILLTFGYFFYSTSRFTQETRCSTAELFDISLGVIFVIVVMIMGYAYWPQYGPMVIKEIPVIAFLFTAGIYNHFKYEYYPRWEDERMWKRTKTKGADV